MTDVERRMQVGLYSGRSERSAPRKMVDRPTRAQPVVTKNRNARGRGSRRGTENMVIAT